MIHYQDSIFHALYALTVLWVMRRAGRAHRFRNLLIGTLLLSTLSVLIVDALEASPGAGARLSHGWPFAHPALVANLVAWGALWAALLFFWMPRDKGRR
jgi:hypothetical protein